MTHFKRWGAVWILTILFAVSWIGQALVMAAERGPFPVKEFWAATFENWQSEFLQLIFAAVVINAWQQYVFRADFGADKDDVDKILVAIGQMKRDGS